MKIQLHAVSFLLGLVLSVTLAVDLLEPNFLQVPEDRSQFLGREVVFHCSLDVVELIPWNINMEHLDNSRPEMGLWYAIRNINETAKNSNLTVLASPSYDMAPIFCTGILYNYVIGDYTFKKSDVAVLRVQGVPDLITQFNGDNTSSTMILFEWTPPTHRLGLPPCCDSYYINVTHFSSSESIVDDNVTSPSIEFSISEDRLCDVLLVSIIATNVVGDGAEFKQRWSLGGHFETRTANTSLMYNRTGALILDIRIEIRGYCLSDLSNVTFSLRCDDAPNELVTRRLINALPNDRVHSTELNLTITDSHTERRCLWDVALDNDVDYNGFLSTYDVTNATVNDTGPGYICITCSFIPQTQARGCYLNLTRVTDIFDTAQVLTSANLSISGGGGCVNVSLGGDYLVTVYDWNQDNDDNDYSINPAFNLSTVFIPPPPPPIISSSSSVSSPSPSETVQPSADTATTSIAVGSALGVVILIIGLLFIILVVLFMMYKKKQKKQRREEEKRQEQHRLRSVSPDGPVSYANVVDACSFQEPLFYTEEQLVEAAKSQARQFYQRIRRNEEGDFKLHFGIEDIEEKDALILVFKKHIE